MSHITYYTNCQMLFSKIQKWLNPNGKLIVIVTSRLDSLYDRIQDFNNEVRGMDYGSGENVKLHLQQAGIACETVHSHYVDVNLDMTDPQQLVQFVLSRAVSVEEAEKILDAVKSNLPSSLKKADGHIWRQKNYVFVINSRDKNAEKGKGE